MQTRRRFANTLEWDPAGLRILWLGISASRNGLLQMNYLGLLGSLHTTLQPETYLEIGVAFGASLRISRAKSIGIDPKIRVHSEALLDKPWIKLYKCTSDDFFKEHSAAETLEG